MESQRTLISVTDFDHVPDDELMRRLAELVSQSRRVEADLVAHIGEVEARKLFAREASPSMFAYCTKRLHLSEAEAYLRITVARAARTHGGLLAMLRDGRLHLSGIVRLLPLLTPDNREALLARATHRSKRQILELVAELAPRPDVSARMRKLPQRRPAPVPVSLASATRSLPEPEAAATGALAVSKATRGPSEDASTAVVPSAGGNGRLPEPVVTSGRSLPRTSGRKLCPERVEGPSDRDGSSPQELCPDRVPQSVEAPRAILEPLAPARYKVQFTASAELRDKLERLLALLRSKRPDLDLAAVIEQAVSEKLERFEARRFAQTGTPRRRLEDTSGSPVSRRVPSAVRRAVYAREGGRCSYVDGQGRRCTEEQTVEFHHRHPFAMGGDHSPGNIGLLCTAHNRLLAETDYGAAAVGRHRRPEAGIEARAHAPVPGREASTVAPSLSGLSRQSGPSQEHRPDGSRACGRGSSRSAGASAGGQFFSSSP
jgi:hypothetical protein